MGLLHSVVLLAILMSWCSLVVAQQEQPGVPTRPSHPPSAAEGSRETTAPEERPDIPPRAPTQSWRTVEDEKGVCRWAIPGGWYSLQGKPTSLSFEEGRASAQLRAAEMRDWEQHKSELKKQLAQSRVLDDTAARFWLEQSQGKAIVHHIAVPMGNVSCEARIVVTDRSDLPRLAPVIRDWANKLVPARRGNTAVR
jgi:hypothetical protein